MALEKTHRMNVLFSFYESLLTKKQSQYMQLYYQEDLSLGEIAESFDVSRQAVYDAIKRTEVALVEYEKNLKLVQQFINTKHVKDEALAYIKEKYPEDQKLKDTLEKLQKGAD